MKDNNRNIARGLTCLIFPAKFSYFPDNYIEHVTTAPRERASFENSPWFFPGLTQDEANELLKDKAIGSYLVRPSAKPNTLTGIECLCPIELCSLLCG